MTILNVTSEDLENGYCIDLDDRNDVERMDVFVKEDKRGKLTLKGSGSLKTLHIAGKGLEFVIEDPLLNLREISLYNLPLKTFPKIICQSPHLKNIFIDDVELDEIPPAVLDLKLLKRLRFKHEKIPFPIGLIERKLIDVDLSTQSIYAEKLDKKLDKKLTDLDRYHMVKIARFNHIFVDA